MSRRRTVCALLAASAAILAAGLVTAGVAGPPNLLENPDFDEDVAGWFPQEAYASIDFDELDVDEALDSGSAKVNNASVGPTTLAGAGQCVRVVGTRAYNLSGWIYIPSGQNRTGTARFRLRWHGRAQCDQPISSVTVGGVSSTTPDIWFFEEGLEIEAPEGASGVVVVLEVQKPQAGQSFSAQFDSVFLPEPAAAVGFAAVLLTLAVLRRAVSR